MVGYQFGKSYGAIMTKGKELTYDDDSAKDVNEENGGDDNDGEEDIVDGDLSAIKPGFLEPCKMVRGFAVLHACLAYLKGSRSLSYERI